MDLRGANFNILSHYSVLLHDAFSWYGHLHFLIIVVLVTSLNRLD